MCHRLVGKKKLEKDGDKVMEARHKKKGKREREKIKLAIEKCEIFIKSLVPKPIILPLKFCAYN